MANNTIDINTYKLHETDTGSADVQIAQLTKRITHITGHLKQNKKDFSSRRGLLKLVARRRRLIRYLQKCDQTRYQKIKTSLGIRG